LCTATHTQSKGARPWAEAGREDKWEKGGKERERGGRRDKEEGGETNRREDVY